MITLWFAMSLGMAKLREPNPWDEWFWHLYDERGKWHGR